MNHFDIFNDDAFSLVSMVAAINEVDHVPGRAGQLAFAGAGEGVATHSVSIESKADVLTLIQTSQRGAPSEKQGVPGKRLLKSVHIPHIKLEDSIQAASVIGVREFGSTDQLRSVQTVINSQLGLMAQRMDLTLEHHRLGALKGEILDADGSTLTDLFELFGKTEKTFSLGLDEAPSEDAFDSAIRVKCQQIDRYIRRSAKMPLPTGARVWALCGDNFFDHFVENPTVKEVFKDTASQERRFGDNYAFGIFEFGGIAWENYRGTDDGEESTEGGTVGIHKDECRFFLTGVPGLYREFYAPADFMETVNSLGLPRYAKLAPDTRFNQYVEVHVQTNPLPLCMRPQTLCKGTM